MQVRVATPDDVDRTAAVLAEAFDDYPWMRMTVDNRDFTRRLTGMYAEMLGALVVPHGRAWVAESDAGEIVGASGWFTPASSPGAEELGRVTARVRELRGDRAAFADEADRAVGALQRDEPAWHLGTLGVLPAARGVGVASALLRAGLDLADAAGEVAVLETSSVANLRLYERHGFAVSDRVDLADGQLTTWLMRRPPTRR